MNPRTLRFMAVGAAGFIVQLTVLAALTRWAHWPLGGATILAVEAAVLINFVWHERWTWRDRSVADTDRFERLRRFHLSNGLASVAGNLCVTMGLVAIGVSPLGANTIAVGVMSIWNFLAADRWVFLAQTVAVTALVLVGVASASAAEPASDTIAAWNRHVTQLEASMRVPSTASPLAEPEGRSIKVPGGIIHEWRGSVVVPGVTVAELVNTLQHPESLPAQEDVAETRVLARHGDSLRVYFRLVRRFIVSVTYDSEHDVTYVRRGPTLVTSRSVATRIAETDGGDRGFLWRLNSYWQYRQVGPDVLVDVLSVSLSRDVPMLARPIAGPIIDRIGRESMLHTLAMVRSAPLAMRSRAGNRDVTSTRLDE